MDDKQIAMNARKAFMVHDLSGGKTSHYGRECFEAGAVWQASQAIASASQPENFNADELRALGHLETLCLPDGNGNHGKNTVPWNLIEDIKTAVAKVEARAPLPAGQAGDEPVLPFGYLVELQMKNVSARVFQPDFESAEEYRNSFYVNWQENGKLEVDRIIPLYTHPVREVVEGKG